MGEGDQENMIELLFQLFITFFIIGLFNFGGGGAMISLIHNQIVEVHHWISETAFTDITAISQTTPGPIGINCATYVGYQVMHDRGFNNLECILGSAASTLAIVLPSFIVFLILVKLFNRFHDDPRFLRAMSILKPAVAGMILAACIILSLRIGSAQNPMSIEIIRENFPDWKSWLLFGAAFGSTYFLKANPIVVIVCSGVIGLLLY